MAQYSSFAIFKSLVEINYIILTNVIASLYFLSTLQCIIYLSRVKVIYTDTRGTLLISELTENNIKGMLLKLIK